MNQAHAPGQTEAVSENAEQVLDVLVVGAGFAGVCAGIKLLEKGISNFKIYDKAAGIGGTWYHNTYPGAACDIPSHLYCYSFAPNPNWTRKWSRQKEIQNYIIDCAERYGVTPYIQLNTLVHQYQFCNQKRAWRVTLGDGSVVVARHVISALGGLHVPMYPKIAGMEVFAGATMHSASWDHSVDFNECRVAVIGSAASAIQLIPELAKVAKQLDVYQRTPNYIAPRGDFEYSEKARARFKRWPLLGKLYRQMLFYRLEWLIYPLVKSKKPSRWHDKVEGVVKQHIRKSVADSQLREKMVPDYEMGCKRMLSSDDFFAAINRDNVQVITDGVAQIKADQIVDGSGESHPADIIVYATGFDIENYPYQLDAIGPDGVGLRQRLQDRPEAYMGMMVPGLPNMYTVTGPNTGVGTASVVHIIEAQIKLILQCIEYAGMDKLIEVKQSASEAYNARIKAQLADTIWAGSCDSWYKRDDGEIIALYPGSAAAFSRERKKLRPEDFELSSA